MSVYYPSGCDALIPDHICDPCEAVELGRVSSVAFIKDSFDFIDPSNPVEWRNAFAAGNIILIPDTKGTFDGGAEVTVPGYGRQSTRLAGYNFQAQFQDPNYRANGEFYDAIKNARNYKFAFATETQIHITEVPVQVIPKNPVQDDTNSEVVWDVLVQWSGKNLMKPFDIPPTIFDSCVANP